VPPLPKRQYQKTREREFKHNVSHGIRHSYQPYIREISTPDWAAASPAPAAPPGIAGFDIREAHGRLEFCEHRIINGRDPQFRHPAQAIAAAEIEPFDPTPIEAEKVDRYDICEVTERIPRFWPERQWDRDGTRMTEEETKRLEEAIAGPECPPKPPRSAVRIRQSPSGPPKVKKTSLVVLDFHKYETDGSETETDWEDF
jgi:hypothetical protein